MKKNQVIKWSAIAIGFGLLVWGVARIIRRSNQDLPYNQNVGGDNNDNKNCDQEFPLKLGSCGDRVILLNTYLFNRPDNNFTKQTESELYRRHNIKQVTKEQFQQATSGFIFNLDV